MCHIQIATENNRLFLLQLLQKLAKIILPLHPIRKSRQLILGVRRIAGHHIIIRVLRRNDAPFMIVLLNAETVAHAKRLLLRKQRCSRISFLLRIAPILIIPRKLQINLPFLQLALLNTENIRIQLMKYIQKSLSHTRPQAVYVPGNHFFHSISPFYQIRFFRYIKRQQAGGRRSETGLWMQSRLSPISCTHLEHACPNGADASPTQTNKCSESKRTTIVRRASGAFTDLFRGGCCLPHLSHFYKSTCKS